jgi:hypothetical protein
MNLAALAHLEAIRRSTAYQGHTHFLPRAFSRRAFLSATGVAPALFAKRKSDVTDAQPIPGGEDLFGNGHPFHFYLPAPGFEPMSINDFNGFVGFAQPRGHWIQTGGPGPLPAGVLNWDADMRFMIGNYVGVDGRLHQGTFGFI